MECFVADIEDPVLFQQAYFQVINPEGMVPYKHYGFQEEITRDQSELTAIVKARQVGISTSTVLDKIHAGLLNPQFLGIFISLRQDQANELIYKAKLMIDQMPEPWTIGLEKKQEGMIQLDNGARLVAVSAHQSAGRGWSGDLVLDEFAHVPNDRQIMNAAMSVTVRKGWKVRMQSTPYGNRGVFAQIIRGLQTGEITNWSLHEVHWTRCPDLEYSRIMDRCISDEMFQQEYCLEFSDERTSMLPWDVLMQATDVELPQWNLANCPTTANPKYFGVDPAEKVNYTGFIVAEKIGNKYFIRHVHNEKLRKDSVVSLCKSWKKAARPTKIVVDETGMGVGTVQDLQRDLGKGLITGVSLSAAMKERLVYNMVGLFESGQVTIPDHEMLKQQLHSLEKGISASGIAMYTGKVKGKGNETGQDDLLWATALSLSHNLLTKPTLRVSVNPFNPKPVRRRRYGSQNIG